MPTEKEKVCWYKDGKLHREDGPAIEWSFGTKEWWVAGNRHRLDGPAVEAEKVGYMWFKGLDVLKMDSELELPNARES